MAVSVQLSKDGKTMTIAISERFDFNVHRDLRRAYDNGQRAQEGYVIDLRNTTYMDSSALGMLLQLREYAGGGNEVICVKNANASIKDVLRIASFDKLMRVE